MTHLPTEPDEVSKLFLDYDFHSSSEGYRQIGKLLARQIPTSCGTALSVVDTDDPLAVSAVSAVSRP